MQNAQIKKIEEILSNVFIKGEKLDHSPNFNNIQEIEHKYEESELEYDGFRSSANNNRICSYSDNVYTVEFINELKGDPADINTFGKLYLGTTIYHIRIVIRFDQDKLKSYKIEVVDYIGNDNLRFELIRYFEEYFDSIQNVEIQNFPFVREM